MSSVDFSKCKGAAGAARIAHMERHDGKDVDYANKWIDRERTHLNSVVDSNGIVEDGKAPSSRQTLARLKERVREIDAMEPPKRIRKDRVTMVTLTVAAPEGLPPGIREKQFFQLVYDEIAEFCGGAENVSCGFIHRDEVHDYIDTDGSRRTSRPHMHMAVIPYVEGKGVNGKAFETRARMRALNERIDQRCREELHCAFMTRQRGRTGRTVEELQAMSEGKAGERARRELNELEKALSAQREAYDAMGDYLDRAKPLIPIAGKERKTLGGKVKSIEVAIEDWATITRAFDEMHEVVMLRNRLEKELGAVERMREAYEQNNRNVDAAHAMQRQLNARIESLRTELTDYRQAVERTARKYPGFAQDLAQELRPAIDKVIEEYNRREDVIAQIRAAKRAQERGGGIDR